MRCLTGRPEDRARSSEAVVLDTSKGGEVRTAVLVKQVPRVDLLELLPTGRLRREGIELEMNPYCRRAVTAGVDLARSTHGSCVVMTLGPPAAEDVLREAVAWGCDMGVLMTDPAFAGSDTLATASALAAALRHEGPFDLVLLGRNSVDADTGQVGPQIAELLDLPFVAAAREIRLESPGLLRVRSELDDGWRTALVKLPAVVSVAERLCEPAKVPESGRRAVAAERVKRLSAVELGPGPWGEDASRTVVGSTRVLQVQRHRVMLSGDPAAQAARAVQLLTSWGVLDNGKLSMAPPAKRKPDNTATLRHTSGLATVVHGDQLLAGPRSPNAPIVVLAEPGRHRVVAELLGAARRLSQRGKRELVLIGLAADEVSSRCLAADRIVAIEGAVVESDVAAAVASWSERVRPWALLAPATLWGREVAARVAARLRAGLTGDAVDIEVGDDDRIVSWKPAFGGRLVAAVTATSELQMVTVRPGALVGETLGEGQPAVPMEVLRSQACSPVKILEENRDDDVSALLGARAIVAVGTGVPVEEYAALSPLLDVLGAELAATRKVTDCGWLPRARQVGLTGHYVSPALYVAIGISGKFNHMVGARSAKTIVAINSDPNAAVFEWSDIGLAEDWHHVVPLLVRTVESHDNTSVSA